MKVSTLEPDRRSSFCPSCLASPCSLDNPERLGERSDPFPFLSALTPYKLCRSLIQGSGSTCLRPPQTRFTSSFDDCSTASGLVKEGYIPVGGYPEQTLFGVWQRSIARPAIHICATTIGLESLNHSSGRLVGPARSQRGPLQHIPCPSLEHLECVQKFRGWCP